MLSFLKTGTILASFQSCGLYSVSQMCKTSLYRVEVSFTPPCFQSSAGIPLIPGALPLFVALMASNSSLTSGFSSRDGMFGLSAVVSKTERSIPPVILSSL